jgi:hypothetical protein
VDTPLHGTGAPEIQCPYCLEPVAFDPDDLYTRLDTAGYEPLEVREDRSAARRNDVVRAAFQRCPNTHDMPQHYIPAPYLTCGPPLTVAMVGGSAAGKTHLLAAMFAEIEEGGLERFGLGHRSVNSWWHDRFLREQVGPLRAGHVLAHTRMASGYVQFVDALLVGPDAAARPVAFFDLAGEDLVRTDATTRFLAGIGALIFIVDPVAALRASQLDGVRNWLGGAGDSGLGDRTFGVVLDRIDRTGHLLDVPAAVVVTKSDLIRYEPPVNRWLMRDVQPPLDPVLVEQESRDVYAFLHCHGATAWLKPYLDCRRCTLHFASATGGEASDGRYPRGAHARRALLPLLSILAMSGLLGPDLAGLVGR